MRPRFNLRNALRAEIDRRGLAVFLDADMQPVMRVVLDPIGKRAERRFVRRDCVARLVVFVDPPAMPHHSGHRAAGGQEVAVAEGIASHNAVRRHQRVRSDTLDQREQLRSIHHLDFLEFLLWHVERVADMLDVEFVDEGLVGGEVLGRPDIRPLGQ